MFLQWLTGCASSLSHQQKCHWSWSPPYFFSLRIQPSVNVFSPLVVQSMSYGRTINFFSASGAKSEICLLENVYEFWWMTHCLKILLPNEIMMFCDLLLSL